MGPESNLYAVIPAYNPGPVLVDVARRTEAIVGAGRVLVVDDGSRDGSGDLAGAAGFRVVRHPGNRGKGAALNTGYRAALDLGAESVVTLDADGQHHPEWIPRLVSALTPETDIVIGSRMTDPGPMPLIRVLTNRFMSSVLSGLARQRILDTQSGFRIVRRRVLEAVPLVTERFETESELLIRAGRKGFRIAEVPIPAVYGDEKSKIRPLADTWRWVKMLWASRDWR
jgi:glycosyltransferase involved in cell wall biosynthesis